MRFVRLVAAKKLCVDQPFDPGLSTTEDLLGCAFRLQHASNPLTRYL